MSLRVLYVAKYVCLVAFCAAGIGVAFWHHHDGPIYMLAVAFPALISAGVRYAIHQYEKGPEDRGW